MNLLRTLSLALCLCLSATALANPLPAFVYKSYAFAEDSDERISRLIEQASHLAYPSPQQARPMVVDALKLAHEGADLGEYDYLYAQYLLIKTSFSGPESSTLAAGTEADYLKVSSQLFTRLDQEGKVGDWVFTPAGKLRIEAFVFAGNALAWDLYEKAKGNRAQLEKALEIIEKVTDHADDPVYYFSFDTQVRILLALGKTDDAYTLVRAVLTEDPDFKDFADIKVLPAYQAWVEKNPLKDDTAQPA
ncbi:hypothetical protein [Chitinimonas sp. BJYL2]|uniref:hypothetical protein n=1 Tax=Chitinimonas sp. BJYL2 TaxID=2976696 RepID=UPI0022B4A879|nr:hypothetical protein [Chitinimonas sp. BJYL2]